MSNQAPRIAEVPFGSNAIRLSGRQLVCTGLIVLFFLVVTPVTWNHIEPFQPPTDYRLPYALSEDYWTYRRMTDQTQHDDTIWIIGDSVVWGKYVRPDQTLSHFLNQQLRNQQDDSKRFINAGVNGSHPLALWGLVQYYALLRNRPIILHCNLLWMNSLESDLQSDKEELFNHPHLIPQFDPRMTGYRASFNERLSHSIDRTVPFRRWVRHVRVACFDGFDLPTWSLENPAANPFDQLTLATPPPKNEPHSAAIPWTQRRIQPNDFPWIDFETSLQGKAFRATAELLEQRGNRIFVIVGPINEHMLTDASRRRYQAIHNAVVDWLRDKSIPIWIPPVLPSDEYGDTSHPLAAGYGRLARQLSNHDSFQAWLKQP